MTLIEAIKKTSMKEIPERILKMITSKDTEMVRLGIEVMHNQQYSISYAEYMIVREHLHMIGDFNVAREILAVLFFCTKEYKEGKFNI